MECMNNVTPVHACKLALLYISTAWSSIIIHSLTAIETGRLLITVLQRERERQAMKATFVSTIDLAA